MSQSTEVPPLLEQMVRTLEEAAPTATHENYRVLADKLVSTFQRANADLSGLINRLNYLTHVVRPEGKLHDPDAPKTLDPTHPAGKAFLEKLGA